MGTNAIEAKARFKTLIDDLPDFANIQRSWGFPNRDPEKRWLYVGNIEWDSSEWHTNRNRREVFMIRFGINVQMARASGEDVERECIRLMGVIEDAVKADPTLGGLAIDTNLVPDDLKSWPGASGAHEGQVDGALVVSARL